MSFENKSNFHCTPQYFKEKQTVSQRRCKAAELKWYRPSYPGQISAGPTDPLRNHRVSSSHWDVSVDQCSKEQKRSQCHVPEFYISKGQGGNKQNKKNHKFKKNPTYQQDLQPTYTSNLDCRSHRNRYLAETHSLLFDSLYMQEETCRTSALM